MRSSKAIRRSLTRYACGKCGHKVDTLQGIRSHISQTPTCRDALRQLNSLPTIAVTETTHVANASEPIRPPVPINPVEVNIPYEDLDVQAETLLARGEQTARAGLRHSVTVEEVEDIEAGGLPKRPWIGEFPDEAATVYGHGSTAFEEITEKKRTNGEGSFEPFTNREDWELASWLVKSGLSQQAIEDFLTLPIVRTTYICSRAAGSSAVLTECFTDTSKDLSIISEQIRLPEKDRRPAQGSWLDMRRVGAGWRCRG